MKPTKVPAIILVPVLFFSLILTLHRSSIDAAAIICGNDAATKTESFKIAAATTTTNEQSLPNQRTSSDGSEIPSLMPLASTSEAPTTTTATTTTTTAPSSDVKQFFQTVQCTLEKAKPWVEEIEKEAKRLEETAKRFSEGVINKLGDFMEKLIPNVDGNGTATSLNTPTKSLFSTILDSFETVVVGVVGSVTGNKTKLTAVEEPVKKVVEAVEAVEAADAVDTMAPDTATVAEIIEHADDLENQITHTFDAEEFRQVCPIGFMADRNGVCHRVNF